MYADPYPFQLGDGGAHVDGIAAEPIQLCDDQHVASFQAVQQLRKTIPARDCDAS